MLQSSAKKDLYHLVKLIAFAVCIVSIVFLCRAFIYTPVVVKGQSMEPTFENNNRLITSKISSIERFDMVVFEAPDKEEQYIKRIIGLPGDHVEMKDDMLYINGEPYEESYVKRDNNLDLSRITEDFTLEELTGNKEVPAGHYFVLGDNRLQSKDSRDFGVISADSVVGEVQFQYFPFQEIGIPK